MAKLTYILFLICALSLIVEQKCSRVMQILLQDRIITSAWAPFDDKGNLNYAMIPKLAQYYRDNDIRVVYVSGYTGSGPTISLPDRKRFIKAWEEQANIQGFDLIVEVGAMPFVDTLELVNYCSTLNITAITAFPEFVYQASTVEEAMEDLQRICDASESKLPLMYHELSVVHQKIKTDEIFLEAMDGGVSCFSGVITNVNNFLNIKASVDSIEDYQIWSYGMNSVAASFEVGMNATQSVNLFPDLTRSIKEAVENCQLEQAENLQQELNRKVYAITNLNGGVAEEKSRIYLQQEKAGFQLLSGLNIGYRYPLERPSSIVIEKIRTNLQSLGVQLYGSVNVLGLEINL